MSIILQLMIGLYIAIKYCTWRWDREKENDNGFVLGGLDMFTFIALFIFLVLETADLMYNIF